MRKEKLLLAMLAASLLFLSGCDDDSTAEAQQYECEQWLNDGEYDKLISSASQCGSAQDQRWYKAAAYAGKAGFTLTALIANLTEEDEGDSDFVERLGKGATTQSVADLNESKRLYGDMINPDANNTVAGLRPTCLKDSAEYNASAGYQRDACFIRPLVSAAHLASQMNRIRATIETPEDPENMSDADKNATAQDLANIINNGELELLAETLGAEETSQDGEDKSTSEAVDEITTDMCQEAEAESATYDGLDATCDAENKPTNLTILWYSEQENN
jgi:hypothetical protein